MRINNRDEAICSVCDANFFTEDLDEHSRCKLCASQDLMPGGEHVQEAIKSEKQRREESKALLRELLAEIKEEDRQAKILKSLQPKACKKCGNEFQPTSAAHAICSRCKASN